MMQLGVMGYAMSLDCLEYIRRGGRLDGSLGERFDCLFIFDLSFFSFVFLFVCLPLYLLLLLLLLLLLTFFQLSFPFSPH